MLFRQSHQKSFEAMPLSGGHEKMLNNVALVGKLRQIEKTKSYRESWHLSLSRNALGCCGVGEFSLNLLFEN